MTIVLAGLLMSGVDGAAYGEGSCPAGYTFSIQDGARIHRSNDLKSPVDGIYYTHHDYRVHQFLGGTATTPHWVNLTDVTTAVSGWVNGSVATCFAPTSPNRTS
ncbi:hypothetical protein [Saccharopolyspora spinosa]|uniref:hypothetical protein n=1 Tax=Saccharopolyspora spinosa TaxID=60894 RepID=UPI000237B3EC|nr:hypothetical protein [Saccharopolyspora spinosa]